MSSESPSTSLLFVGSYAPAGQPGLHVLRLDETTGALAPCGTLADMNRPAFLAVHPNRRWVYACSEAHPAGRVYALRYEPPGGLTVINYQSSGGSAPCHACIDQSGRWVFVANYVSGSAAVLPIGPDGALGERTDLAQHAGRSANPQRQEGPHAHSVTVSADNRFVFIADLGIDEVVIYRFDAEAGRLSPHARAAAAPGAGPRHTAFDPTGTWFYVANELDSTVAAYAYDPAQGTLQPRQTLSTLPAGAPENIVAHIQASAETAPGGPRVYVSNRGHDSLAVLAVRAGGALERLAVPASGGRTPRHFALSPSGRWMVVANQDSDRVTVLPVEASEAGLGPVRSSVSAAAPSCIQFL